jgi:hypothetical protein
MVSATVPGKLGSSRPSHIAECSCQLRLRRLAERRHGYPTERANSCSHLFHIDVTAVAKLKMSLNLCCDVRIEYALEVVRHKLDDLLTMDRHTRPTLVPSHRLPFASKTSISSMCAAPSRTEAISMPTGTS